MAEAELILSLRWHAQVALFSENSSRWLVADQAVMMVGAADAVRGASSPAQEMAYIVEHSESCGIIAQDSATLERLAPALPKSSSSASNGSNGSGNHVNPSADPLASSAVETLMNTRWVLRITAFSQILSSSVYAMLWRICQRPK